MSTHYPEHLQNALQHIDELSEDDLRLVNRYIVDRVKELAAKSTEKAMAQFSLGDHVSFVDKNGTPHHGMVRKINKKTVGITNREGGRYNVSPQLLTLSTSPNAPDSTAATAPTASVSTLPRSRSTSAKDTREWVSGTITMPGFITGEPGENYQPLLHLWLNEFQQVIGMSINHPDDQSFDVVSSLKETIANPKAGSPGAPTHLRVNDKHIAEQIRRAFPSIVVSVGPTPELDDVANALKNDMQVDSAPQLYSDIADDNYSVERFFQSTAALYKFAPWKIVPHDECLIGITAKSLGITDGVLSVIGQQQKSFGVLLFDTINHYEQYRLLIDAMEYGAEYPAPPHRALSFDNAKDLAPEFRKDIVRHQWEVAGPKAYPDLMCLSHDQTMRPTIENDLELFDAVAQTLQYVLKNKRFVASLSGSEEIGLDYELLMKNQPVSIVLQSPYPYKRVLKAQGATDDLIAELLLLQRTAVEEPDWDEHDALTDTLFNRYMSSPEAKACNSQTGSASLIMSMTYNYCGCTIATITPHILEEILFSIIPRKVMIQAKDAADIINDTRAFLQFLIREYKLDRAEACLSIIDANAVNRLAKALGDTTNFGMAKSMFSPDTPFPMDISPDFLPKPPATKAKPADKKSRKKKRSASRKARKKNR